MKQRYTRAGRPLSRREALRLGLVATGAATVAGLVGTSRRAAGASVTMKLGSDSPAGHPFNIGFEAMKKEIETRTQGRVTATIYPDGQLGGEEAMTAGLKIGSVDAVFASTGVLTNAVPELGLFDLFFLFRDVDHVLRAANGPIGAKLKTKIEAAVGGEVPGWGTTGSRNMWNSKRPIKSVQDVKGLKMRVQSSKIQQDSYTAFGALPTPIAFVEVYSALQTGVVDGADIGVADMLALKFYQVTKYMTLTRNFFINNPLLLSKRFLEQLSPADQDIVREAGKKGVAAEVQANNEQEVSGIQEMKTKGLQVFDLDSSARQEFVKLVEPVYAKHAAALGGMALIQQARDA